MAKSREVDKYISGMHEFSKKICIKLRTAIFAAAHEIREEIKWGMPVYSMKKMVCCYGAFREHVMFTFFQGATLKDEKKILKQGTANKHNRNIKFKDELQVDDKTMIEYVKEAIANEFKAKNA